MVEIDQVECRRGRWPSGSIVHLFGAGLPEAIGWLAMPRSKVTLPGRRAAGADVALGGRTDFLVRTIN